MSAAASAAPEGSDIANIEQSKFNLDCVKLTNHNTILPDKGLEENKNDIEGGPSATASATK